MKIPLEEIAIIKHSRQSLLFCPRGEVWQRKDSLFDVTMGAPDGAEVCELVGVYILHKLSGTLDVPIEHIGLYRDDGLIMARSIDGPGMERIRKQLFATFKSEGLKITVSPPSNSVDFLDVTFCKDGSFRPFRKPGKVTQYVHRLSNHPPSITRNIPDMIKHRINSTSSSSEIFDAAKQHYEDALKQSEYEDCTMEYTATTPGPRKRNRKRNIIWFNPPFSNTVETNIGRRFLNLIDKHFIKAHKFHKIFNRNCVKVSYSCMPNVEATIKSHNKQLLQKHLQKKEDPATNTCNCRSKASCPLDGECLATSIIYKADISTDNEAFTYVGMTEGTFKKRFSGHQTSFRLERYKAATKLSEKVWHLKERDLSYKIKWSIVRRGRPYVNGQSTCDLCTSEKLEILLRSKDPHLLNSRNEILAKCRHKRKFGL
jgi:hypothetical protein